MIVSDSVDNRDALLIDSGAMYGPPPTLNSVPDGVMMICAGVGWPRQAPSVWLAAAPSDHAAA